MKTPLSGFVGILNVGAGDTKLVFDPNSPADCARAARTLADMIRRGYVILVEAGKDAKTGEALYKRVLEFREDTCEYIIAGDADVNSDTTQGENNEQQGGAAPTAKGRSKVGQGRHAPRPRTVHASTTSGIAVARTAGG